MKKLRKLLQNIYCHRSLPVIDPSTGKKEIAIYNMWFGLPTKIAYKPA